MVPTAELQAHRRDVAALSSLATNDLRVLIRQVSTFQEAREAFMDVLPGLIATYGSAAASLGADWYDDLREQLEVPGSFRAIPAELPDQGRAYALAGWSTTPTGALPEFVASTVLSKAAGGLQRAIADADRGSVTGSSVEDPRADGWQRVGTGSCAFCAMLIGRGAVYTRATATFGSHDDCRCAAAPAFGGRPRTVRPYEPSARNISDADRARVREFIAANGL